MHRGIEPAESPKQRHNRGLFSYRESLKLGAGNGKFICQAQLLRFFQGFPMNMAF